LLLSHNNDKRITAEKIKSIQKENVAKKTRFIEFEMPKDCKTKLIWGLANIRFGSVSEVKNGKADPTLKDSAKDPKIIKINNNTNCFFRGLDKNPHNLKINLSLVIS
jgi:hypothetical protein